MVLQVHFEDFADSVKRVLGESVEAYVAVHNGQTLATASGEDRVIAAIHDGTPEEAKQELQTAGLRVFNGRWTDDLELEQEGVALSQLYVAGVAYKTEAGPPGIWVDAFPSQPTQVQVLRSMYDEFIKTGEMANVSFEEFARLSDANTVVVSPSDLRSYVTQKLTTTPAESEPKKSPGASAQRRATP